MYIIRSSTIRWQIHDFQSDGNAVSPFTKYLTKSKICKVNLLFRVVSETEMADPDLHSICNLQICAETSVNDEKNKCGKLEYNTKLRCCNTILIQLMQFSILNTILKVISELFKLLFFCI